jgi:hypothetical protein
MNRHRWEPSLDAHPLPIRLQAGVMAGALGSRQDLRHPRGSSFSSSNAAAARGTTFAPVLLSGSLRQPRSKSTHSQRSDRISDLRHPGQQQQPHRRCRARVQPMLALHRRQSIGEPGDFGLGEEPLLLPALEGPHAFGGVRRDQLTADGELQYSAEDRERSRCGAAAALDDGAPALHSLAVHSALAGATSAWNLAMSACVSAFAILLFNSA